MNKIPVSFRCYFPSGEPCNKVQEIRLSDGPRWIESYLFTHPQCTAISIRILARNLAEQTEV